MDDAPLGSMRVVRRAPGPGVPLALSGSEGDIPKCAAATGGGQCESHEVTVEGPSTLGLIEGGRVPEVGLTDLS